jgi:hypothetical protein
MINMENNFLKAGVYGILLNGVKSFFTIWDEEVTGSKPVAPVNIFLRV